MLRRAYYGGAGQSSGDTLAVSGTLLATGTAWFVDSVNGDNSNTGTLVDQAKATLVAAEAAAAEGDIIFLLPGHAEVLTSTLTLSKNLTIVGCGKSGDKPSPTIACNGAGVQLLTAANKIAHIRNVRFLQRADAAGDTRFRVVASAVGIILDGCWFECAKATEAAALTVNSAAIGCLIRNSTFESVATSAATQPVIGWSGMPTAPGFADNVRFDGGEYGWSVEAWLATAGNARAHMVSLLYGANVVFGADVVGLFHTLNETGEGSLSWSAVNQSTYRPGLGAMLGPLIATSGRITMTRRVLYVSSVIGDDSYSGFQRQRPKATLAAALTAASALSVADVVVIVLAADHSETLTSTLTISDDQRIIIGEGKSGGEPTATIGFNGNGASIKLVGDFCELRNIKFTANQQANATPRVWNDGSASEGVGLVARDLLFECDQYDTVAALQVEGDTATLDLSFAQLLDLTFRSTQSDPALAPTTAIEMESANTVFAENVTLDGGSSGFSSEAMVADGVQNLYMLNTKLLNGADIYMLNMSATDGVWVHFSDESESAYVRGEQVIS